MSVVTICAGIYCRGPRVARKASAMLGWELWDDLRLARAAARGGGPGLAALERALSAKPSILDRLQHENERSVARLSLELSSLVPERDMVFLGKCGHLIPRSLPQVLRVGLIADKDHRIQTAGEEEGISAREAGRNLAKSDQAIMEWTRDLLGKDPWDSGLYDILIPVDKKGVDQAVEAIVRHASDGLLSDTGAARRAAEDYRLSALVQAEMAEKGHQVKIFADQGEVTLEINKKVLRFNRLEAELKKLAGKIPGVGQVTVKPGPKAHRADIYRSVEFDAPGKILLVDDEREFVETLSERLHMRNMNAAVVYDGEQALELLRKDEPEIMVLDLMMPGIDGMEVLRRVKENHSKVEVIILTGHGSEEDRKACKAAGAFDYLQKPVDIDDLSQVMRNATAKARGHMPEEA